MTTTITEIQNTVVKALRHTVFSGRSPDFDRYDSIETRLFDYLNFIERNMIDGHIYEPIIYDVYEKYITVMNYKNDRLDFNISNDKLVPIGLSIKEFESFVDSIHSNNRKYSNRIKLFDAELLKKKEYIENKALDKIRTQVDYLVNQLQRYNISEEKINPVIEELERIKECRLNIKL